MKKVLLIGYPFPLRQGGSPRLLGLAKYLPEFDWQPIILTAPLDQKNNGSYRIVETGYRNALGFWIRLFGFSLDDDLRKQVKQRFGDTAKKSLLDRLLTFVGEIVNYPDSEKGWRPFAIKAGDEIIRREGIDAIISTSAPVTAHLVAKELKRRHKTPWLADLRDLWSENHNYSYSRVRKWFDRRLERKTLSTADALVTVSPLWSEQLKALHKGKPVYTITNGFDPETVNVPPAGLSAKFTITYTGTIYPAKQDTTKLFAALRDLVSSGVIDSNRVDARFYGAPEDWLDTEIRQYGLSNVASQYGQVPRDVALRKQWESQVLLLLDWDNPAEKGVYPLKIFEYLAARRPILATGGVSDNAVAGLLRDTQAGVQAPAVEDIKKALAASYQEYKISGKTAYHADESKIDKYSYREMARAFSEVLNPAA